jgi:NAD(P)H-flavin reductase
MAESAMTRGARASLDPAAGPPAGLVPASFRVTSLRRETRDTFTLELVPAGGGPGLAFAPGQFNMLYVFGVGEVPISISGDPARPATLVHTVRSVGAVTRALCAMRKGDVVGVRGPFGTSWPVDDAAGRDVLVVAGGIGIAPVRPILHEVLARRARYGRVVLLYGARTPADLLYTRDLEHWRSRLDAEVRVTVDTADRTWRGNVGTVGTLIAHAPVDAEHAVAFVCGPEVMMRFVAIGLQGRGMAGRQIYVSMERNMKCAVGLCGHCQIGPYFVCKDGPVFDLPRVRPFLTVREM